MHKRLLVVLPLLLLAVDTFASYSVRRIATGLEQPVWVAMAPGDSSRLFVVEANSGGSPTGPMIARIKILNMTGPSAGTINATPFLTISGIDQIEDQGLFGLAFHPNYQENGFFYVNYAFGQGGGSSVVERYKVSAGDPDVADPTSATRIFTIFKPFFNHNGNWLAFSPREVEQGKFYLYHITGDGGSNQDPMNLAQDLSVRNGKVLRVDVGADGLADAFPADTTENYAIPPDNPFVGVAGADPMIWARGLRNPWRSSFDRLTNDLYIGNVGANQADEVEFQPFDSPGGENYMWSRFEGTQTGSNPGAADPLDQFPMYECLHTSGLTECPTRSLTGGYVYRGPVQELHGQYLFGDFLGDYNFGNQTGGAQLFSIRYDGSNPTSFDGTNVVDDEILNRTADFSPDLGSIRFLSSFGEDHAGNLYIIDMGNLGTPDGLGLGEIFKVCGICEVCLPGQPTVPAFCNLLSLGFSDRQTLTWNAASGAASYDIVKGDLGDLLGSGGDYADAVTDCLAENTAGTSESETDDPGTNDGFFYLIRGVNGSGDGGSYESGVNEQRDFRDGEIYAATGTCS